MLNSDKPRLLFISILGEPGRYPQDLFDHLEGGDDEVYWFRSMLSDAGLLERLVFTGISVCRGSPLPKADDYDAIIVGGSFHSVHDNLPWQNDLVHWLTKLRHTGKPTFGICGGHQLMAKIDGAVIDDVPGAPIAGSFPVSRTNHGHNHFLFSGISEEALFHFGNLERVSTPPEGTIVLAENPAMPAMALDHGGNWYSVQYHPEASRQSIADSWTGDDQQYRDNYAETPEAPKMLQNFLEGTGVLK